MTKDINQKETEKPKISFIVPAYNEGRHIYENMKKCIGILSGQKLNYELIIVNDGSTDNTQQEACKIKTPYVKVVGYPANQGKGHAILYGLKYAEGELVAFIDSDLDIDPQQISVFLKHMERHRADIVIGSKRHPESKIFYYPLMRRFFSSTYNLLIKRVFGLSITDTQTGFKLLKRKVLEDIVPKLIIKRYAFDMEILVYASSLGYKIVEAPIVMDFQRGPWGRIKLGDILHIAIDTMAIAYKFHIPQSWSKILRNSALVFMIFVMGLIGYKANNPLVFPGIELRALYLLLASSILILVCNLPWDMFAKRLK